MPYKDPEKQKEARRKYEQKRKGKRHSIWLIIFYPEDCPGWEQELAENGIPCLVSPVHDNDFYTEADEKKNPEHTAGKKKKDHRHIVVEYENPVDYETVQHDFDFLTISGKKLTNIKYGKSISASTLYLAHETADCERAGKAPYDPSGILAFCGADYVDWKARKEDVHAMMREMRAFCRENNIFDFYLFWDWCDQNNDEWSRLLDVKCAYAMERYLKSLRSAAKAGELVEPGVGLSATPTPGGAEPRTPNPDE